MRYQGDRAAALRELNIVQTGMVIGEELIAERLRAHAKHGVKSMEGWGPMDPLRLPILVEEVGEVAREMNEAALAERTVDAAKLRAELIQVAAMATAWAAALAPIASDQKRQPIPSEFQGNEGLTL